MSHPFEPLASVTLKHLTLKTVFLISLASAKRRSEIHALDFDSVAFREDFSEVRLEVRQAFLAKSQIPCLACTAINPLVIPALPVDPRMTEDLTLCPVRALRTYLDRTAGIRAGRKRLFISFKEGYSSEICVSTVSSWVKQLILEAYKHSSSDDLRLFQAKPHEVRALSSSWALFCRSSFESVMAAAQWRSHNTFTGTYLRDCTFIRNGMRTLGPVVVAQSVVHPPQ